MLSRMCTKQDALTRKAKDQDINGTDVNKVKKNIVPILLDLTDE